MQLVPSSRAPVFEVSAWHSETGEQYAFLHGRASLIHGSKLVYPAVLQSTTGSIIGQGLARQLCWKQIPIPQNPSGGSHGSPSTSATQVAALVGLAVGCAVGGTVVAATVGAAVCGRGVVPSAPCVVTSVASAVGRSVGATAAPAPRASLGCARRRGRSTALAAPEHTAS